MDACRLPASTGRRSPAVSACSAPATSPWRARTPGSASPRSRSASSR
jgi:hypothetical protein